MYKDHFPVSTFYEVRKGQTPNGLRFSIVTSSIAPKMIPVSLIIVVDLLFPDCYNKIAEMKNQHKI